MSRQVVLMKPKPVLQILAKLSVFPAKQVTVNCYGTEGISQVPDPICLITLFDHVALQVD